MSSNRDDFSEKVKAVAAGRVGFRCSFPGCNLVTIGACMENNLKTSSIGQAAHICAAAKGGPRYDANMTPEDRKSVQNCIWMCDNHARLIDTDTETYTVEKLRQWKEDAERKSSLALANREFFRTYCQDNVDNYSVISGLLESLIIDGNFTQLKVVLSQYREPQAETLDELVVRYKVILDVYCDHSSLDRDLRHYLELPCKIGVSKIIETLFGMLMAEQLKLVVDYCTDDCLKKLIAAVINNTIDSVFIVPAGSEKKLDLTEEMQESVSKAITTFIIKSGQIEARDSLGNNYKLYEDEFFFQLAVAFNGLKRIVAYNGMNSSSVITSKEYSFIAQNIGKLNSLDKTFKEYYWQSILSALLGDRENYEKMYRICPEDIKQSDMVKSINYMFCIETDTTAIQVEDLISFSDKTSQYGAFLHYLERINHFDAAAILDEHAYLFKKNSAFLLMRLITLAEVSVGNRTNFLEKYSSIYIDDFLYRCLLVTEKSTAIPKSENIQWLKEHKKMSNALSMDLYIKIMADNNEWEELWRLCNYSLLPEYILLLANALSQATEVRYLSKSREQYKLLLEAGWERKWVRYNLGIVNEKLGSVEEAKQLFQKEYDRYRTIESLKALIFLRYNTNEIVDDTYLLELGNNVDCESQHLVGAMRLKLLQFAKAQECFLRALLLDDKRMESIVGLFQSSNEIQSAPVDDVRENTVCILRGSGKVYKVAIHPSKILQGINANHFAECAHYSIDDPIVSNLFLRSIGEVVQYNGENVWIESISPSKDEFQIFAFKKITTSPSVQIMHASTAEGLIQEITPILKSSSDSMSKLLADYNESEIRFPLTVFSKMVGKDMLTSCRFLAYGNTEKIRNNPSTIEAPNTATFVLSYDSIVFLACLELAKEIPAEIHMVCSKQVKNQLLSDIATCMRRAKSKQEAGYMTYTNNRVTMWENTPEAKRTEHAFLTVLKDFVEHINVCETAYDYFPGKALAVKEQEAFLEMFSAQNLMIEGGTLALAQKTEKSILVTDDQFLFVIANEEKIENIGLVSFLPIIFKDWKHRLNISKGLKELNFGNYLPLNLYEQMVTSLCEDGADTTVGSREIQSWIISDTDDDPSEYHEDVIMCLARDVFNAEKFQLNPGCFLSDCVFRILQRRSPKKAEELVKAAVSEVHAQLLEGNFTILPGAESIIRIEDTDNDFPSSIENRDSL